LEKIVDLKLSPESKQRFENSIAKIKAAVAALKE
jgi:malate/lactate dehydrogenase